MKLTYEQALEKLSNQEATIKLFIADKKYELHNDIDYFIYSDNDVTDHIDEEMDSDNWVKLRDAQTDMLMRLRELV